MRTPIRVASLTLLLSAVANAQHLVLPENTNLVAPEAVATGPTSGRFQIAYDSSHFTNAGVTGPITITRLRFRAYDGEPNVGGQTYGGVTIQVGNCAVDYASMSTSFAANRGTMGAPGSTTITLAPASGTVPNNNVIDINLAALGASFVYNPATGADLLIDLTFGAAVPGNNLPFYAAGSSTLSIARAQMLSNIPSTSTTGFLGAPAVVTVDFTGTGGHPSTTGAHCERYGHGCDATFRSFYQDWRVGETFDLAGKSITMTPNSVAAPTGYTVTLGTTPPDLTRLNAVPDSIADNALVTHALGFAFNYVGGSTTTIKACTEGYVWLDAAMTLVDTSPDADDLLSRSGPNYTARLSPCWYDWNAGGNVVTFPHAGLHVVTDTSGGPGHGVCYVTWYRVGRSDVFLDGQSASDFQAVFYQATGVMEMRFGTMQVGSNVPAVTGWSRGKVAGVESTDPGSRDLSQELLLVPLQLAADVPNVNAATLDTVSQQRPIIGGTITPLATNLPAGSLLYLMMVDLAPLQPGVPIPGLLAPGCVFSLTPTFWVYSSIALPPSSTWAALPLTISPAWPIGGQFYGQVAAIDFAFSNLVTTNAIQFTVGLD